MSLAIIWPGEIPRVRYLTVESGRNARSFMLKKALFNCDIGFRAHVVITIPSEKLKGMSPGEQIDYATDCFGKLRWNINNVIKSGKLRIKRWDYFNNWEFRPKTGEIHGHMLIVQFIPWRLFEKILVRSGFGYVKRMIGINRKDEESYKQVVEYTTKYITKGGWNVTRGRRRYSMSRVVSESLNRWLKENKKPFAGKIMSIEEIAEINREKSIELVMPSGARNVMGPGYLLYDSPIRKNMEKLHEAGKNPNLENSAGLVRRSCGGKKGNLGLFPWEVGWKEPS